ncbi:alpha/beta hydrolase family protein [Salinisphaera aquimarina]|uniref:Alpha/beta hydrolase family protein n=1 Tax=Salinisphaera aquimarina TaxID=2094031 RepID=A0ABV7EVR5_9GAMM
MRTQQRWFHASWLPLLTGLGWLILGSGGAWIVTLIAAVPGALLLASGTALLLWPGDRYITHYLALGGLIGMVLAVLLSPWLGVLTAVLLALASAASFIVAGRAALLQAVLIDGVPAPDVCFATARKAATDEALLGFFITCARIPLGDAVARDAHEITLLQRRADADGWAQTPADFARAPAAPADPRLQRTRSLGCNFDWLSFTSEFAPDPGLPGAARWRAHRPNERVAARVFQHPGKSRPWLVCIHGYRMGIDALDLSLFEVKRLHYKLGLNLLMPILPLHGARSVSRMTGGYFFDGPMVDLLHAESQALWDLRRCLKWIHATQPGADVGTLGYSLGGYNAALLAAYEPSLACVIAGIPVTDIPAVVWQHMPLLHRRYIEAQGIDVAQLSALMAPVSPLHLPCAVAPERRYVFAATADQMVSPQQPLRLWQHWGEPAMHWYHGSHLSVRRENGGRAFIDSALHETGLTAPR